MPAADLLALEPNATGRLAQRLGYTAVVDEPVHVRLGFGRATLPEVLALFESWIETRS